MPPDNPSTNAAKQSIAIGQAICSIEQDFSAAIVNRLTDTARSPPTTPTCSASPLSSSRLVCVTSTPTTPDHPTQFREDIQ